jgi:hypothetical protein
MPDITACDAKLADGTLCPLARQCYRNQVKPDKIAQSYFVQAPYKDGGCEHHWPWPRQTLRVPKETKK